MSRRKTKNLSTELNTVTTPDLAEQTVPETDNGVTAKSSILSSSTRAAVSETRYGVVYNARYVNVRDEPSQTGNVIRIANEGERVIILYSDNGFYKVQFIDGSSGFIASDFIKEIHGGETPDDFFNKTESILTSVKKLLGIDETCEEFDIDVMLNINAAIFTLRQLGVGPADGFTVTSKNATYSDFLGEDATLIPDVKMYLYYKTKLGFDPPASATVMECIKEMIRECEWRLNAEVDPGDAFVDGGEIQNEPVFSSE